jgi:DNA-binding MarR family transcriptional regulator
MSGFSADEDPTTIPLDRAAVWHDVVLAAHLLQVALERQAQRDGNIPHGHLKMLVLLSGADRQTLGLKTLTEMLRYSPSRVSHALTVLERQGLVTRGRVPEGRRATLTSRGQLLVARVLRAQRRDLRDVLLDSLEASDAAALGTISSRVVEILERAEVRQFSRECSDRDALPLERERVDIDGGQEAVDGTAGRRPPGAETHGPSLAHQAPAW